MKPRKQKKQRGKNHIMKFEKSINIKMEHYKTLNPQESSLSCSGRKDTSKQQTQVARKPLNNI